ncbi:MAG: hypothetical protein KJO05_05280 [Bacteroidia bacterium]|nr:hypothetical protein [Bacteroidia bacterium]MBT8274932.1 hypothetical protein [Bacteroidia bacterium]NNF30970.1 hypothetical protein [Flavobacteriaceae bacterium]NNK53143.1 hypothetical protein [Flavobacteriaceae bacterium]
MQNLIFHIFVVFLITSQICAQKTIQKQWIVSAVDTVLIASDQIYNVRITSGSKETINLTTSVEGEVYETVVVKELISGKTLQIGTGHSPYFSPKNDKLAAHKVLSVEMVLTVPPNVAVVVHSKNTSVIAEGTIAYLETVLEKGHCTLQDFKGDARLFTVFGDISVAVHPGVGGRAISKEGVTNELKLEGDYFIEAESINGLVSLVRQE